MRDLLADKIALLNQLSSLHGTVPLPQTTVNHTRLREVPSLVSWVSCFNAYVAVLTSDPSARDMLRYSWLLIREARRHGGSGWMEYDRVLCKQRSINPSLAWNTLEPALQAATILGQSTSAGTYCTICRECDHNANQCALSTLQQQLHSTSCTIPQSVANPRPQKRIETLMQICVARNKGLCRRPDCNFRHICHVSTGTQGTLLSRYAGRLVVQECHGSLFWSHCPTSYSQVLSGNLPLCIS